MSAWEWPQWVAAASIVTRLIIWLWKDGRAGDVALALASVTISVTTAWVLWMGGFWS